MSEPIDDYAARMQHLFDHGDMSYHLAKLLEECGELAQAVNKRRKPSDVYDEVADVVLSALLIGNVYRGDYPELDAIINTKLKSLESNPDYRNFDPPPKGVDNRD